MLTAFSRAITNIMYNVRGVSKKYADNHPVEKVIFSGAAKGVVYDAEAVLERNPKWITARRSVLLLTSQNIVHGKLLLPLQDIVNADVYLLGSSLGRGMVLRVNTTDGKQHQFGMQYDEALLSQTTLKISVEEGKLKYSLFSIALRVILFGIILREIYLRFFAQ